MKASDIKVGEAYYHARGVDWRVGGRSVGRFVPASEPHAGSVTGQMQYASGRDVSVTTVRTHDLRGPYDEAVAAVSARLQQREEQAERKRQLDAEREAGDDERARRLTALGIAHTRDFWNRGLPQLTREGMDKLLGLAESSIPVP